MFCCFSYRVEVFVIKHCQRHNGPEGWVHLAKVILQVQTQILIEFHLQNLDSASTRNLNQTSASPLNLKFKILTQPSFRISTKIQLHNLYKTSAAKCWTNSSFKILLNFNIKILTNPCAQRHHQATPLSSWQHSKVAQFFSNQQAVGIIHNFTKRHGVSQWVTSIPNILQSSLCRKKH